MGGTLLPAIFARETRTHSSRAATRTLASSVLPTVPGEALVGSPVRETRKMSMSAPVLTDLVRGVLHGDGQGV